MKKSILTFAVFSLVVLTSFTTVNYTGDDSGDDNGDPTTTTTARQDSGTNGNGSTTHAGDQKKHDFVSSSALPFSYTNSTSQNMNFIKKTDF